MIAAFTAATPAASATDVGARLVLPAAAASVAKLAIAIDDGVPASASTNSFDAAFIVVASLAEIEPDTSYSSVTRTPQRAGNGGLARRNAKRRVVGFASSTTATSTYRCSPSTAVFTVSTRANVPPGGSPTGATR